MYHNFSPSLSLSRVLSLSVSLTLSIAFGLHPCHASPTPALTLTGGRALHHGHQLIDQHALRMPLAELLQMLILIREALD